jgi:hypothetical protein
VATGKRELVAGEERRTLGETADETRDAIAIRDIRGACCAVEFAHDGVEQIAQLEQLLVGAFLLGDHPIDAGPKLVLDVPRDPVSLICEKVNCWKPNCALSKAKNASGGSRKLFREWRIGQCRTCAGHGRAPVSWSLKIAECRINLSGKGAVCGVGGLPISRLQSTTAPAPDRRSLYSVSARCDARKTPVAIPLPLREPIVF